MNTDAILKLTQDAYAQGEQSGLRQAVGVVQAYLAVLNDPDISKDCLEARRDQLEKVLATLLERRR
jgi:hypothetical protein